METARKVLSCVRKSWKNLYIIIHNKNLSEKKKTLNTPCSFFSSFIKQFLLNLFNDRDPEGKSGFEKKKKN